MALRSLTKKMKRQRQASRTASYTDDITRLELADMIAGSIQDSTEISVSFMNLLASKLDAQIVLATKHLDLFHEFFGIMKDQQSDIAFGQAKTVRSPSESGVPRAAEYTSGFFDRFFNAILPVGTGLTLLALAKLGTGLVAAWNFLKDFLKEYGEGGTFYTAFWEGIKGAAKGIIKIPEQVLAALGYKEEAEKIKAVREKIEVNFEAFVADLDYRRKKLGEAFAGITTTLDQWILDRLDARERDFAREQKHYDSQIKEAKQLYDEARAISLKSEKPEDIWKTSRLAERVAQLEATRTESALKFQEPLGASTLKFFEDAMHGLSGQHALKSLDRFMNLWNKKFEAATNTGRAMTKRELDVGVPSGYTLDDRLTTANKQYPRMGHSDIPELSVERPGHRGTSISPSDPNSVPAAPMPFPGTPNRVSPPPSSSSDADIGRAFNYTMTEEASKGGIRVWLWPHRDPQHSRQKTDWGIGYSHHMGAAGDFKAGELIIPANAKFNLPKERKVILSGYDWTVREFKKNEPFSISREEAASLLWWDLSTRFSNMARQLVGGRKKFESLSDRQKIGLTDLTYHQGTGFDKIPADLREGLGELITEGKWDAVAGVFDLAARRTPEFKNRFGRLAELFRNESLSDPAFEQAVKTPEPAWGYQSPRAIPQSNVLTPSPHMPVGAAIKTLGTSAERDGGSAVLNAPVTTTVVNNTAQSHHTTISRPLNTRSQENTWRAINFSTLKFV